MHKYTTIDVLTRCIYRVYDTTNLNSTDPSVQIFTFEYKQTSFAYYCFAKWK